MIWNFFVSSDGLEAMFENQPFNQYIFQGGKDLLTLELTTIYQFIILLVLGVSNKLTNMNYTYFLYDTTKTALPLTDMFAKSKTEEKTEDSTKPTVGTYNSLNTLKRPLLKPSPLNRVTPSELSETEPAEKGAEAVEPAKTEDPVEPAPEAPKKEKKNAASIILSIYYYLNILFIVGFCISLLWSVDILMGFEIIMVLISINIGKWGVCLVYNAIFLICRLMVSIYFDSNCKEVYPWFSLFGFEGLQSPNAVVPIYITNVQNTIPCLIMILNAFIYMISYYDFYTNDYNMKTKSNTIGKNKFTKFIQNNWVWVLYLYMLFLIFSDVPNILNLATLFFFIILNTRHVLLSFLLLTL